MMKLRFLFLPSLLFAAAGSNAQSPTDPKSTDPVLKSFEPPEAVRGTPIKIVGENLKGKNVTITLNPSVALPSSCPQEPPPPGLTTWDSVLASDDSSVTFVIDRNTCLGNYTVTASIEGSKKLLPGTLHIIPKDLKLTA